MIFFRRIHISTRLEMQKAAVHRAASDLENFCLFNLLIFHFFTDSYLLKIDLSLFHSLKCACVTVSPFSVFQVFDSFEFNYKKSTRRVKEVSLHF